MAPAGTRRSPRVGRGRSALLDQTETVGCMRFAALLSRELWECAVPVHVVAEQKACLRKLRPRRFELEHHVGVGVEAVVEEQVDLGRLREHLRQELPAVPEVRLPQPAEVDGDDPSRLLPARPGGSARMSARAVLDRLIRGQVDRDECAALPLPLFVLEERLEKAGGEEAIEHTGLDDEPRMGEAYERVKEVMVLVQLERFVRHGPRGVADSRGEIGGVLELLAELAEA